MEAASVPEPATTETGKTKFYVFRASDDLRTYTLVAVKEARDRDHALRLQFGKAPPLSVAVSEHQFKVRKPKYEPVVRGLTDVEIPDPAAPVALAGADGQTELATAARDTDE